MVSNKALYAAALVAVCGAWATSGPPAVSGWSFLQWGMTLEESKDAFAENAVAATEHYTPKDGLTLLTFDRDGWSGTAYFDEGMKLSQVLLESPRFNDRYATLAAAAVLVDAFGAGYEYRDADCEGGYRSDVYYQWRQGPTTISVTVAHYLQVDEWVIWEQYTPARP